MTALCSFLNLTGIRVQIKQCINISNILPLVQNFPWFYNPYNNRNIFFPSLDTFEV